MAKAAATTETQEPQETTKKMTKKDAEAIIAKYDGINGSANEPEELTQAKEFLKKG